MKSVICKYCESTFTPLPGKPGYINECPDCLHAKTAPPTPKAGSAKQRKAREDARRALAALGAPAQEIERFLDSIPSKQL
jgi:hypothetical protein